MLGCTARRQARRIVISNLMYYRPKTNARLLTGMPTLGKTERGKRGYIKTFSSNHSGIRRVHNHYNAQKARGRAQITQPWGKHQTIPTIKKHGNVQKKNAHTACARTSASASGSSSSTTHPCSLAPSDGSPRSRAAYAAASSVPPLMSSRKGEVPTGRTGIARATEHCCLTHSTLLGVRGGGVGVVSVSLGVSPSGMRRGPRYPTESVGASRIVGSKGC